MGNNGVSNQNLFGIIIIILIIVIFGQGGGTNPFALGGCGCQNNFNC